MNNRWFITGTDTDVGKTVASCALLQAASRLGYRTAGYKPVASGGFPGPEGIRNDDALALQRNSGVALRYAEVNPLVFAEPTSPHIASAAVEQPIEFAVMDDGLARLEEKADWLLVEGAGGWYTPLADSVTFADWVRRQGLPVIMVVAVRLGCINHALLTARAIRHDGLRLAGWIANNPQPPAARHREYLATLRARIAAPLLGEIPYLADIKRQSPGDYLDLQPLCSSD